VALITYSTLAQQWVCTGATVEAGTTA
jgi:hypothetical protein